MDFQTKKRLLDIFTAYLAELERLGEDMRDQQRDFTAHLNRIRFQELQRTKDTTIH